MNIAKSFLSRALSHPDLQALTCGKQTLTYGQLAQRVHGLAGGLLNTLHLEPGARVILCMENRNAFIEVLFAAWTAGLCAVPVLHAQTAFHRFHSLGSLSESNSDSDSVSFRLDGITVTLLS